jgi:putative ABC transport system permease protein
VFRNPDISLFVVDGVVLTVSAVFLVSRHQELIGHGVRRVGGGSKSMALRLGLAYPLARTFRTSIVLMTFALTMFTLVSITLFSGVFGSQVDEFTKKASGGFDAVVSSNGSNPIPVDEARTVEGVQLGAAVTTTGLQFNVPGVRRQPGQAEFEWAGMAGFDDTFVSVGPPALQKFAPRFGSAAGAWRAVLHDPSLVIVNEGFLQERGGPPTDTVSVGDRIIARDPATGATSDLTVAGLLYGGGFGGGPGTPA